MKNATNANEQNTIIKKKWKKPIIDELRIEETTQLNPPDESSQEDS